MRIGKLLCVLLYASLMSGCSEEDSGPDDGVIETEPVPVTKNRSEKIYVHMMPWFETKETNNGTWGSHWKMALKNPDNIVDASTQKREIAAHFYPMIGPYASGDGKVIEYQLLLMKLSGIDGLLIDWYGTINLYDYPQIKSNTEKIIALTSRVGLEYAITYEDQTIDAAIDAGVITSGITAARADMSYLAGQYFTDDNYIRINDKPLLTTFGPQYFQSGSDWSEIMSVFSEKPEFLTLWYQSGETGENASGEFSWVYQDQNPHLFHLNNFYDRSFGGIEMGSAYPGFRDYYKEGGWGDNYFLIEHNGTATFSETLQLALDKTDRIQLVTWNDYGEGTMIEPTLEFGYSFLTTLQTTLGVPYTQEDLELVAKLYQLRKEKTDPESVKKLNLVFDHLVSLRINEARTLLASL